MTLDTTQFRSTLGLFATGVAVIATEIDNQLHAMTANAISSVSLDPMLVLFCPAKRARISELLPRIRVLDQFSTRRAPGLVQLFCRRPARRCCGTTLQVRCGRQNPTTRRRAGLADLHAPPELRGGDHWIVTALVTEIHQGIEPHRPLLFFKGQYRDLDRRHATRAPDLADNAEEAALMYYHL